MKTNQILLFAFLLTSSLTLYAQDYPPNHFGVTIGGNVAQIQTSLSTVSPLWRYNAGITFEQRFLQKFMLAGSLLYSRQGSAEKNVGILHDDKFISTFDYAALPLYLRLPFIGRRSFIEVGGQLGYLLGAKNYYASRKNETLNYQHTQKFDAGLTGGLGYRLGSHLTLDARYYHGMRPLRENYTAPDPQTGVPTFYRVEKWYNRVWSLNLTYYFPSK